jgi:hypothetical protein
MKISQKTPQLPSIQPGSTAQTAQSGAISSSQQIGGDSDQIGGIPGPIVRPEPPTQGGRLTEGQLATIAGVGGEGLSGYGKLTGRIAVVTKAFHSSPSDPGQMLEIPMLVTLKKDNAVVSFELELPVDQAKALVGQTVTVEGHISKTSKYGGVIESPAIGETSGFPKGTWAQLSGKVENRQLFAIGGEAPPSGSWLKLDTPITVDGKSFDALFIQNRELKDGAEVKLNGRLDIGGFGGVETPPQTYLALSGVTDLSAGEPVFDGKVFTSSVSGKELDVFSWVNPMIADIPSTLWIVDQGADRIFIGASGGFIPQHMNPWHGISDALVLRTADETDRKAIKLDSNGEPSFKGSKLELVGSELPPPGTADMFSHEWYIDPSTKAAFHFVSGGIAGFQRRLDQVAFPSHAPDATPVE